jgi:hypothetical protein
MRILLQLCNMASRAAARRGQVGTWDPAPGSTPRPEAAARVFGGEGSISSEFTGMRRQRPRLGYRESGGGGHGWGRGRQGKNGIDRLDFVTESVGWIGMEG